MRASCLRQISWLVTEIPADLVQRHIYLSTQIRVAMPKLIRSAVVILLSAKWTMLLEAAREANLGAAAGPTVHAGDKGHGSVIK